MKNLTIKNLTEVCSGTYHGPENVMDREVSSITTDSRKIEKDSLFAQINLQNDELVMYQRVHEALAEKIPPPDLIVYLRASTDLLMQRIAQRDRPYERSMERSYIDELNHAYDDFFLNQHDHQSPVLIIETDSLDFVRHPEDMDWIENRIRQSLGLPPYQPELPLQNS